MREKTITKIVTWVLLLFLLVQTVTALGVRPAQTTIISDETSFYSGKFWVVNNDHIEFDVALFVQGELEDYIVLDRGSLTFSSDTEFKEVKFEMEIPEDLPGGKSINYIVAEQILPPAGENSIAAKLMLRHKVIVEGPYPDKYISAKLNFHDRDSYIEMVSEVENLGKENINQIKTTFYLNDKEQNERSLITESTTLVTDETKLLSATLPKELVERGEFEVRATTTYDDQRLDIVQKLVVGKPSIQVTYFDPFFIVGKINEYSMDLLNSWNTKIKHVYVDVEVTKNEEVIDEFRTKSVDLEGEVTTRLNDYFDTREKSSGLYGFNMVVNFLDLYHMETQHFESEILPENEGFRISSPPTGAVIATPEIDGGTPWSTLFWVALTVIIMGIIGLYGFWRYKNREDYEDGEEQF